MHSCIVSGGGGAEYLAPFLESLDTGEMSICGGGERRDVVPHMRSCAKS